MGSSPGYLLKSVLLYLILLGLNLNLNISTSKYLTNLILNFYIPSLILDFQACHEIICMKLMKRAFGFLSTSRFSVPRVEKWRINARAMREENLEFI